MPDNLSDAAPSRATLNAQLELGQRRLRAAGRDGAVRLEAEILLAHVLQQPRSYLAAHADRTLEPAALERYWALLSRAAGGEPVAYLIGRREFWSLDLCVTSAVLIPRPETELAVERSLALLDPAQRPRVCDLGTGSGAIALALAAERPHWHITATDRSAAALEVARSNAQRLGLSRIEFLAGDWLEPLGERRFQLIVSNPPYVSATDPALPALRHEPLEALSPGPSGLEALQRLICDARACLAPDGWLVLEHGAAQGAAVTAALVEAGYARVGCHRDLAGRDRISEGQYPGLQNRP